MEKVLEQALPQVTKTIEPTPPLPPAEPEGGFPWCGTGIVVLVVVAALVGRKLLSKSDDDD
jgi:hypothetical protein|tara:strand:+ start:257 stop:439 length:183 start_codon:yes stop_codon:yes gene_type:complete